MHHVVDDDVQPHREVRRGRLARAEIVSGFRNTVPKRRRCDVVPKPRDVHCKTPAIDREMSNRDHSKNPPIYRQEQERHGVATHVHEGCEAVLCFIYSHPFGLEYIITDEVREKLRGYGRSNHYTFLIAERSLPVDFLFLKIPR